MSLQIASTPPQPGTGLNAASAISQQAAAQKAKLLAMTRSKSDRLKEGQVTNPGPPMLSIQPMNPTTVVGNSLGHSNGQSNGKQNGHSKSDVDDLIAEAKSTASTSHDSTPKTAKSIPAQDEGQSSGFQLNNGRSLTFGNGGNSFASLERPSVSNHSDSIKHSNTLTLASQDANSWNELSKPSSIKIQQEESHNPRLVAKAQNEVPIKAIAKQTRDREPQYFDELPDLQEWLKITGYFDTEYRQKNLNLQRKIAELDAQKAELARLAGEENAHRLMRESGTTPPIPSISNRWSPIQSKVEAMPKAANYKPEPGEAVHPSRENRIVSASKETEYRRPSLSLKRAKADDLYDISPESKYQRTESGGRQVATQSSYTKPDILGHERPRALSPRGNYDRSPEYKWKNNRGGYEEDRTDVVKSSHTRESMDWRDRRVQDNNPVRSDERRVTDEKPRSSSWTLNVKKPAEYKKPYLQINHGETRDESTPRGPLSGIQFDSRKLGLFEPGNRFFMIKSFTHDTIIASQKDGIWTTQKKNEELFTRAFNNSRNVIFVFSVNLSKAFQGYARMESLPGTEENPRWSSVIHWPMTGGFRIKWVTIASTRFVHVAHLKNSMNEGESVLFGRDGQEIEKVAGAKLCEIIDDNAKRGEIFD